MQLKIKSIYLSKAFVFAAAVCAAFLPYSLFTYAAEARLNISYSDGKSTLSVSKNGIFENKDMVPGDTADGKLIVSNRTGETVYYRLKGIYGQPNESELIKKTILTISNDDEQILYKGSFKDAYTPELIINKGKSEKYTYRLHIPIECGNEIIGESKNLRFVYMVSDKENGTINGGDNNDGTEDEHGGHNPGGGNGNDQESSDTGIGGKPNPGGSQSGGSSGSGSGSGSGSSGGSVSGSIGTGSGNVIGNGYYESGSIGLSDDSDKFIAQAAVYAVPDFNLNKSKYDGNWIQRDEKWYFQLKDGSFINNGWAFLYNPYGKPTPGCSWYYFNKDAVMQTGWIKCEQDSWYYTTEQSDGNKGSILTGWLKNKDDGRTYYLSKLNGRMLTGRNKLKDTEGEEHTYYFARLEDTYRQNWFFNTKLGRWIYDNIGGRTYGSLYIDELTPEGYYAGKDGAQIEK